LPEEWVKLAHSEQFSPELLASFSQWRLDYPLPLSMPAQKVRTLLSIVETILTRGTSVPMPAELESLVTNFESLAGAPAPVLKAVLHDVAVDGSCPYIPASFDSPEEEMFVDILKVAMKTEGLRWAVTEQVSLGSLVPLGAVADQRRVDFVLNHPGSRAIVVEIDGLQHETSISVDKARDAELLSAGIDTNRIPAEEMRLGGGPGIDGLNERLKANSHQVGQDTPLHALARVSKFLHQVQVTALQAMKGGWLRVDDEWAIDVVIPEALQPEENIEELTRAAIDSLHGLVAHVFALYGENLGEGPVRVSTLGAGDSGNTSIVIGPLTSRNKIEASGFKGRSFFISDVSFPGAIAAPLTHSDPLRATNLEPDLLRWFLRYLFRKDDFWEGQIEALSRTLRGLDSVVLLPTGGGKSVVFQLAGLLLAGRTIVVDPIIALIEDQIANLGAIGIDRCLGLSSSVEQREHREYMQQMMAKGHYLFTYVAPQRFQIREFREALQALTTVVPIAQVAIDEAHCVSEWGHGFMPAYLNLGRSARASCASAGMVPPLIALTGTASRIVLKDIQRELAIGDFDSVISPRTFDRPELSFLVTATTPDLKRNALDGLVSRLPSEFGVSEGRFLNSQDWRPSQALCSAQP